MEKSNLNMSTALIAAILFVCFFAGIVDAATLTVNAISGVDYSNIQEAIDNASLDDTILVFSGTMTACGYGCRV
jgi:hypothetical protein